MKREEYLHSLGLWMLLLKGASLSDMTDTLGDFEAVICEAGDTSMLGTPREAALELDGEGGGRRIIHGVLTAVFAAFWLRWAVLLFESYWRPAVASGWVFATGAVIAVALLFWLCARLGAQAVLLPLSESAGRERTDLWIFSLLSLLAAAVPLAICRAVLGRADIMTERELLSAGPRMVYIIHAMNALCLGLMAAAVWKVFCGKTRWAMIFCQALGASGTLLAIRRALTSLTDIETAWSELLVCAAPYGAGLLMMGAFALIIRRGEGRGEKLWTRK